ncbi:MAG: SpoVR family protein, partial [Planctomycetota bacterium]
DIEDRWNKGRFGREYDECDDRDKKKAWDTRLGQGREKIFEVRRIYNDVMFIDHFLTKEFCEQEQLFIYSPDGQTGKAVISDRDFQAIKQMLLFRLTNAGRPIICVEDANYANRSELLLRHQHEGMDLMLQEAHDTLKNLHKVWQRPVHLETIVEERAKHLTFDGEKHSEEDPGDDS